MGVRFSPEIVSGSVLALMLFSVVPPTSAHEPVLLDPNRATPEIRLELVKVPLVTTNGSEAPGYRLAVAGLPTGIVFSVWTKHFGHGFHEEVDSGFRVDETGKPVLVQRRGVDGPRYLDQVVFRPEAYPRGANWQVAVASTDRTITGFATVIPRPIVARDGTCVVSLELVSHRGLRFLASGSGFATGEDVVAESRSSGRVSQKQQRASANGLLPPELIAHAALDSNRDATYSVRGRSCEVTVNYKWGDMALRGY